MLGSENRIYLPIAGTMVCCFTCQRKIVTLYEDSWCGDAPKRQLACGHLGQTFVEWALHSPDISDQATLLWTWTGIRVQGVVWLLSGLGILT